MAYSTIQKKHCKCGCGKYPSLGYSGYAYSCAPEEIKEKVGARKDFLRKQQNRRKAIAVKLRADNREKDETTGETYKELWFKARRIEMTGKCVCGCGLSSCKNDDKYFRFSCAHVLAKSKFESIALHPENCVELSYWNGCHSDFDNKGYEWVKIWKPKLWAIVVEKFKILYPFIDKKEYQFIPDALIPFIPEQTQDSQYQAPKKEQSIQQ